jgi:autotransporter-associated beta strand protein
VGNATLTLDAWRNPDQTLNNSIFAGIVQDGAGGGTLGIVKNGTAGLTLGDSTGTSPNTYTGGTIINGGTLTVANKDALGTSTLTLASTSIFQQSTFEGNSASGAIPNVIDLTSGEVIFNIPFSQKDMWLTGDIQGAGRIRVISDAIGRTLTLSGAKTFSGGITQSSQGLNTYPSIQIDNVGSLGTGLFRAQLNGTNSTNGFVKSLGDLSAGSGVTNDFDIAAGARLILDHSSASNHLKLSGVVSGGGNLIKNGLATLTLTGANTYTGATTVSAGVLNIQNGTALGANNNGTTVTDLAALQLLNDITVAGETLTLNGMGVSTDGALRNISGNNVWQGTVTLATNSKLQSDAGSLTFNTAANSITAANKNLTLGGAGNGTIAGTITTGTGTLTKDGLGTWTLSGANTYSGGTSVTDGTLLVSNTSGSGTGTGAVDVGAGAILGGTGTIAGSTTIAGSHSPGNSAGIQTFTGGLEYAATSKLLWELNDDISTGRGTNYDGVDVTGGAFSITSGATIDLSFGGLVDFLDSFWDINQSWKVVDLSGSVTGDGGSGLFSVGTFTGATPSGGSFNVSRVSDGTWNDVFLNWVASAGGPSYATWAAAFSSPVLSDQAADADPDFDGLENALEYVIGSDPRTPNQGGPSGGVVGTNLVLNLNRVDSSETADVGLKVQVSTDLQDWTTISSYTIGADTASSTAGVVVDEGTPTTDPDAITITIPKGVDVKKFARVIVTITP